MSENITIELATKGARAVRRAFGRVRDSMEGMEDSARRITRRLGSIFRSVGAAAAVGVGAATAAMGAFGKSVIDASSRMEQARIKFDAIFGSIREGAQAVENLRSLAARVPATFGEIVETGQTIASAVEGPEELRKRMRQLIQLTAVFPITLREAASNWVRFWRAGAGAADLFREKGINAALGVQAGMKTTVEESRELWNQFFRGNTQRLEGAMNRLADSWVGILSMLEDKWLQFRVAVGRAGLFDAAKQALDEFRQSFDRFMETGGPERFARVFTRAVATMVGAIQGLVNAVMEAQAFVRDTFFGRMLGLSKTSAGQLAEASENLDQLQQIQRDLQRGASIANLAPRIAAATGEAVRPLPGQERITRQQLGARVFNEIQRLKQEIDGPGGLTDRFSDASSIMSDFNDMMDRLQAGLRGTQRAGEAAAQTMGGGGGPGGMSLSDVTIAGGGGVQLPLAIRDGLDLTMVEEATANLELAEKQVSRLAQTTISAFGAMAQAAIRGSDMMATSFINGITQIVRSIPGVGGFFGSIVGAVGGIASAIFGGGSNRPQPVTIENRDPIEVEDQSDRGPEEVIVQILGSADLGELQGDLARFTSRDGTTRIPSGTGLSGAGG